MSTIIGNKYEIIEEIGSGSFGKVFKGRNIRTNETIAIKVQYKDIMKVLRHEAKIYKYLSDISGVPCLRNFGIDNEFNYLVLDLLDISLEHKNILQSECIMYMKSAVDILKSIHKRGVIHRDIKPDNFLLRKCGEKSQLYLIDFGLSSLYIQNNKHIVEKKDKKLIGTATYVSLNMHNKIEPSRRDDLESLCYTFISLYGKELLWKEESKILESDDIDVETVYNKVKEKKERTLEWLHDIPGEFLTILLFFKKLEFIEEPNYNYIISILDNLLYLLR